MSQLDVHELKQATKIEPRYLHDCADSFEDSAFRAKKGQPPVKPTLRKNAQQKHSRARGRIRGASMLGCLRIRESHV